MIAASLAFDGVKIRFAFVDIILAYTNIKVNSYFSTCKCFFY